MQILPEEYPLEEDNMILVKNSLSLTSSNSFIPTFKLKYLQTQRETHKVLLGIKTSTSNLFLLDFKGLSIAWPWKLDWERQQVACMARNKEKKTLFSESRYEDLLFLCYFIPLAEIKIYQLKTWFVILLLYIYYIFRQSNVVICLLPIHCFLYHIEADSM